MNESEFEQAIKSLELTTVQWETNEAPLTGLFRWYTDLEKTVFVLPDHIVKESQMIECLQLLNWQIHKELVIDLDRITTIVGNNDSGKSAVLRALQFLFFNNWQGAANDHVTWGAEVSSIAIQGEGHEVVRNKGPNHNEYKLDSQVFRAFGAGKVPEPISKFLNLGIDNVQQQDDPAFWLSLTSGQAASALNEIFNLTAIDNALGSVGTELRTANATTKSIQDRIDRATAKKEELSWVVQANEDLKELEELQAKSNRLESDLKSLMELHKGLTEADEIHLTLTKAIEAGESVIDIYTLCQEAVVKITKLQQILDLQTQRIRLQSELKEAKRKLDEASVDICPTCGRSF